jgi:DNA-directed RNA polymerase subunit K/omega
MDEVTTETPTPEQPQPQPDAPLIPTEPVPPIESRFLFVDVAALRAKQLRRGARLRILSDEGVLPKKAERLAMEEVRRGLVMYEVPAGKKNGADAS